MATTIKVADTANFVAPFLRYMPQSAGNNNEPLVSSANMLMGIFLSPPFAWSWNRNTNSFVTVLNQQDYTIANLTDFGFLEKATVTDSSGNVMELKLKDLISELGTQGGDPASRPTFICVLKDDNAGNITFRLAAIPDTNYTVKLTYQKAPVPVTSAGVSFTPSTGYSGNATWAPLPDKYAFVYQNGLLALMLAATSGDARFQVFWSRFLAGIIGIAEGLSETDKILFLGNMLDFATQVAATQVAVSQGKSAKAT